MSDEETSRREFLRTVPVAALGVAGVTGSTETIVTEAKARADVRHTAQRSSSQSLSFDQVRLSPGDGGSEDRFGSSVAVSDDGTTAVCGAPRATQQRGAAYVFEKSDGSWQETSKLLGSQSDTDDRFGHSVALSGDGTIALVGAQWDDDPYGNRAGAAYVFEKSDGSWQEQGSLAADDGISRDEFGSSVALAKDGTTALVGAIGDGNQVGAAYVYQRSDGDWSQQQKLTATDNDTLDQFGSSVALSDDGTTSLIGAVGDESLRGSAYIFQEANGTWSQQKKLVTEEGTEDDMFGYSAALSGDGSTALVGARQVENENGDEVGSAYVFEGSDGEWSQTDSFTSADGDAYDYFGSAVALTRDGTTAVIGAFRDEDPQGYFAGSAYMFEECQEGWNQVAKLYPTRGNQEDRFGFSAAMSADGTTTLVGAYRDENDNGPEAGSAYVFESSEITVSDYADPEMGIVDSTGLQQAIEDLRTETINVELLTEVVDAWHNREEIA